MYVVAAIPPLYREIFDICSNDGEPIHREVYQCLLSHCMLSKEQLKTIWDLVGTSQGFVNRTNLYKTLVLVAYAQQGKQLSDKLFDNCVEAGVCNFLFKFFGKTVFQIF